MSAATDRDVGAGLSRRELAKEERRERIIAAAEGLLRERGDTEFSMRELAESAGVAFATPFNLFESKERLLASLLFRRMWPRQHALAVSPADSDPIDHVFTFTLAAFATYADDAELFRPLLRTVLAPTVDAEGRSFEAAADLWGRCLEPARDQGLLHREVDDRRLDRAFHITFRGALLGWVRGDSSAKQAEQDLVFAVGMLLAGAVVHSARERVLGHLSKLEQVAR